ncbi:MAG: hypothetical protein A4E53_01179 [Pelotomaculum sp. PtaB.Bin104]|nr:MAG: hypothetical protein A4E53_01179 [Pelotomaculum sp. PtaB.Bin104]
MLPIGYGKNACWFRFSRYETFENEKDVKGIYIIPAQKSEKIVYNPFDYAEDLISDYLNFGKAIFDGIEESEKIGGALNLVTKYGLLGVITYNEVEKYLRGFKYHNRKIYCFYTDGEFIGKKTFQEYIDMIFPLPNRQLFFDLDDFISSHSSFERNYSERVNMIVNKAKELYSNFKSVTDFKNTNEIENMPDKEYIRKVLNANFYIKNVDLVIEHDEVNGATLNWSADNLFKMIDIIYALKLVDKKSGLAACKNCGNPFLKSRKDMEYCSNACGNSYRVKKCKRLKA